MAKSTVNLNMGGWEIQNAKFHKLASAPSSPGEAAHYYSTADHTLYVYNGTGWVDALSQGDYTFKNGVELVSGTRDVQIKLGTSSNITLAVDSSGLAASVADASTSAKGVIEIATDAEASTGTATTLAVNPKQLATKVTANAAITAATKCKVTYDAKGLVTAGADLVASDIPDLSSTYVATTRIGAANGVAGLDGDGKVPTAQLPSYVDDVIDTYIVAGSTALSAGWLSLTDGGSALTPETGKIYVVLTDGSYKNKTYRWSGSTYVEISAAPGQATESAAGIAAIATTAQVSAGTDNQTIVTPAKLTAYVAGMTKKIVSNNPALTVSGGQCTWTITNTLGTADVGIFVYEVSSGERVIVDEKATSGTITIKMNSTANIAANTYRAVIIG